MLQDLGQTFKTDFIKFRPKSLKLSECKSIKKIAILESPNTINAAQILNLIPDVENQNVCAKLPMHYKVLFNPN